MPNRVFWKSWLFTLAALGWLPQAGLLAQEAAPSFAESVLPFLDRYCAACHSGEDPEGQVELERFREPARRLEDREVWERALRMLTDREMPPSDQPQPSAEERGAILDVISAELAEFDCGGQVFPGRVTIRRLNRVEYNNTIRDLLGIDVEPATDFPSDDVGAGFDNIADVLSIPPLLVEKYVAAAETVLDRALADEEARRRIYVCDPSRAEGADTQQCYYEIVEHFTSRAYRRPVAEEEIERLLELGRFAFQQGASSEEALRLTLQAALSSPHFLFRIEQDPDPATPDAIRELNDYELASRLSYFLWSSMPDDELFAAAKAGRLTDGEALRSQVTRMLSDPKSDALVENFAGQWLQLRDLERLSPDPELFPDYDEPLRQAMRRETELFFTHVMRNNLSVLEFLDADYTFVNQRLARHYGLAGVPDDAFRRVALNDQRRGILTHGSILVLTSNPTRTSPVKRGKWILENILDDPPPPPLPGVAQLDEQPELLGSLRERMEQHRADPTCAVCHTRMDALGFGLENFDAVGAWRDQDGRYPIDPAGSLPGGLDFEGPKQLMQILGAHRRDDFARCLTRKMLTYALGRELQLFDRCAVDAILSQLAEDDYRFSTLVLAIVTSEPFTKRGSQKEPSS